MRMKAQKIKAAGVQINEVGTKKGSKQLGKDRVNPSSLALWVTVKVVVQMLPTVLEFCDYQSARKC